MTSDVTLQRICLRPVSPDIAEQVVDGHRQPNWAADYPTEGDVVVSAIVLRAISAGVDYRPPTVTEPWSGPWQICVRTESQECVIGAVGFKGGPAEGQVEIGYGIAESARGNGYVTDAVLALVQLVRSQQLSVIAETEPGNDASERVLERCGFTRTHTAADGNLWWRTD